MILGLGWGIGGCGESTESMLTDSEIPSVGSDAAPDAEVPDGGADGTVQDAEWRPDAEADASVTDGTCHTETVALGAPRGSVSGLAVAGHPDGWLVVSADDRGTRLWFTNRDGKVLADEPLAALSGTDMRAMVQGDNLLLFTGDDVRRIRFAVDRVVRAYSPVPTVPYDPRSVGKGFGDRSSGRGIPDSSPGFWRFAGHDTASGWEISEVRLDDDHPSGLWLASGSLELLTENQVFRGVDLQNDVQMLAIGDHVRVLIRDEARGVDDAVRTLDVQLGLGYLGVFNDPIQYRIWERLPWPGGPREILATTENGLRVVGVGREGRAEVARGYELGQPRSEAVSLIEDPSSVLIDDRENYVAVADQQEIRLFREFGFTPVMPPVVIEGSPTLGRQWDRDTPWGLAVAVVRNLRDGRASLGLRCVSP
ncbi:MAG: hypothetical protein AAGF12_07220 [Myxococcota bacterium]